MCQPQRCAHPWLAQCWHMAHSCGPTQHNDAAQTQQEIGGAIMPTLVPLAQRFRVLAAVLFSGLSCCAVVGWSAGTRMPASAAVSHTARVGQRGSSMHQPSNRWQEGSFWHHPEARRSARRNATTLTLLWAREEQSLQGDSCFVGSASRARDLAGRQRGSQPASLTCLQGSCMPSSPAVIMTAEQP